MTVVWWMAGVPRWRGRWSEKSSPQLPQHDSKPLLIDPCLFLLPGDLNKLTQLLFPHGFPIKVPVFVHIERLVRVEGWEDARNSGGRWK